MADKFFITREVQRGINKVRDRYGLPWPHIRVDSVWGPLTDRYWRRALRVVGLTNDEILHPTRHGITTDKAIQWLNHPQFYFFGRPGRTDRHSKALHSELHPRVSKPRGGGLVFLDCCWLMPAVAAELLKFRSNGWQGTISDCRYGCCRSAQDQIDLQSEANQYPVAAPGTSEHECYRFSITDQRGAADITYYDQARAISDSIGSPLKNNVGGDPIHFDFVH